MQADCFRVKVPERAQLIGFTAKGERVPVVPGEHVVHRIRPKVPLKGIAEALRFLGADDAGRDVLIPISASAEVQALLKQSR